LSTVFLSPHADDLALSCGGAILQTWFPEPYLFVTVFSRSGFARNAPGGADVDMVSRLRIAEDRTYADAFGARYVALGFTEASLRDDGPVFNEGCSASDNAALTGEVANRIEKTLAAVPNDTVLVCPMGIGGHLDHRIVCHVGTFRAKSVKGPRVFYEDLPYAAALGLGRLRQRVGAVAPGLRPSLVSIDDVIARKKMMLRIYKTQYRSDYVEAVVFHATRLSGAPKGASERLWTLPPSYDAKNPRHVA
jgi:LmbE family N-acetylglucosaminyl deacetylase